MRRDAEASAKKAAERAANEAERAASDAAERARMHAGQARVAADRQRRAEAEVEEAARERALVEAEQWSRRAAAERMEAARRAEALRAAERLARREAPGNAAPSRPAYALLAQQSSALPIADSMASDAGARSSSRDAHSSAQLRPLAVMAEEEQNAREDMNPTRTPLRRDFSSMLVRADAGSVEDNSERQSASNNDAARLPAASGAGMDSTEFSALESARAVEAYARSQPYVGALERTASVQDAGRLPNESDETASLAGEPNQGEAPSWLGSAVLLAGETRTASPMRETLQHSKEKVAGRWFALRGIFQGTTAEAEPAEDHTLDEEAPVLALFSVAGGVGKTSLAASLTRALAAQGERVLLVDATDRGVLPFYFGARDLRPGVIRTFAPPAGNTDQPISLVSYGSASAGTGDQVAAGLAERIRKDRKGFSRVLVDLDSAASGALQELLGLGADVLVPITPDMNSVLSLPAVRRILGAVKQPPTAHTFYLLAQFEPAQALQLDVREILQQQLREQLLPYTVRRSPLIAEALAEGMTVIDYAPGEGIAKDYLQVAAWVRTLAEPAREGLAQARWSER